MKQTSKQTLKVIAAILATMWIVGMLQDNICK